MSGSSIATALPTTGLYDNKEKINIKKTSTPKTEAKTNPAKKNTVQTSGNSNQPVATSNIKNLPDSDFKPKSTEFNVNKSNNSKNVKTNTTLGNVGASIKTNVPTTMANIASGLSAVGSVTKKTDPVVKTIGDIKKTSGTVEDVSDKLNKASKISKGENLGIKGLPKSMQTQIENIIKKLPESKAVKFIDAINKSLLGKYAITNAEQFSKVLSNVSKSLGIAGGGLELIQGFVQLSKGDNYEGGWSLAKGTATLASVFTKATPAGLVMYALYKGDKATKEYGWFQDKKGNNESAVEHLFTKGKDSFQVERKKNGTASAILLTTVNAPGRIALATLSMASGFVINTVDEIGKGAKKFGDKIENFGKNVEEKSKKLIKDGNLAQKVVGVYGYGFAKTTQAVGVFVKKTGEVICKGADIAKKYVGQAVKYVEKKLDQFSNAVSNTIGDVKRAVSNTVGEVKKAVTNTVNRVTNAISNTVSSAWDSFVSIF